MEDEAHKKAVADKLLKMAAGKSLQMFGWAHPDCEVLEEAARLLKGEPAPRQDDRAVGVLS